MKSTIRNMKTGALREINAPQGEIVALDKDEELDWQTTARHLQIALEKVQRPIAWLRQRHIALAHTGQRREKDDLVKGCEVCERYRILEGK